MKPDLRPVDGSEANDELASLAKAIAHPARMRIVRVLQKRARCAAIPVLAMDVMAVTSCAIVRTR